jgi:hypothetical protein
MSLSEGRGGSFLAPLAGKTSTFLMEGREANARFARTLMRSLASAGLSCIVLDLDAFYSSNADLIFAGLPGDPTSFQVRIPQPGSDIEAEFSALFESERKAVVIDSLNSLYHLISMDDGSARGRKMMFALASLSLFARTNKRLVILSMYRREGLSKGGRGRSVANMSDITALAKMKDSGMEFRTERGSAWPGGALSIPSP